MYRLAEREYPTLRRLVTNELIGGFEKIFGGADDKDIYDPELIKLRMEMVFLLSNNPSFKLFSEEQKLVVANKIIRMYEELKDPENEYTFDEFGEYILYLMIAYSYNKGPYAKTSISKEDKKELQEYFGSYYDEMLYEIPDMAEEISRQDFIRDRMRLASVFGYMDFSRYDNETSFIFWDVDYLFYDEPGQANVFFDEQISQQMGFTTLSDNREPVSGSLKYAIEDE